MRSRRERSPIWRDVIQGTSSGSAGGRFVMNDGESAPVYNFLLLQENGIPLAQENGKHIYLETGN
jgi:hypothetical protein